MAYLRHEYHLEGPQVPVAVCIPTIPPRLEDETTARAVRSVFEQTLRPDRVIIQVDRQHEGAAITRTKAGTHCGRETTWLAFLDDDDEMLPHHLATLWAAAMDTQADYVYSWFTIPQQEPGYDPLNGFGQPFDYQDPKQTTVTTLVRRDLFIEVGGFVGVPDGAGLVDGQRWGEDYQFTLDCVAAGAKIVHVPERTWLWNHHQGNTSGRADRW